MCVPVCLCVCVCVHEALFLYLPPLLVMYVLKVSAPGLDPALRCLSSSPLYILESSNEKRM